MAVGRRITELRLAQNLTIEQVAAATKLRKDVISLIEAEDWQSLDLPVFVRNQIRLIAVSLKVNESELLELFDQDLPANSPSFARVGQSQSGDLNIFEKHGKSPLPVKRNPNWLYAIIGFVVVVAIAVFAYLSRGEQSDSLPQTDVTITESQAPSTSPTTTPNPNQTNDSSNTLGVSVVLQASGRSWVTATGSAGNSLFSSFLNAGDIITLTDSASVALIIGDSGVVDVTVNDENLGKLGEIGSPVEITFPIS